MFYILVYHENPESGKRQFVTDFTATTAKEIAAAASRHFIDIDDHNKIFYIKNSQNGKTIKMKGGSPLWDTMS